MIYQENISIGGRRYNRRLEMSDWRYSASALGLIKFFKAKNIAHEYEKRNLYYNFEDVSPRDNDELYLDFAEEYFNEFFHHTIIERALKEEVSDDNIKLINEKLAGNTVMKGLFKSLKYDGKNAAEISGIIDENRTEIIRQTFINSKKMYRKFANLNEFRREAGEVCRLLGYYADKGRKLRSLGFGFNKNSRSYSDEVEFDFIPFAFSKGTESVFINNNRDIPGLIKANQQFNSHILNNEEWRGYFFNYAKGSDFIDYGVEIIKKGMEVDSDENNYYSGMYIREEALKIFSEIRNGGEMDNIAKALGFYIKINENYYISIMKEVTDSILNLCDLDYLISILLKLENYSFVVSMLIKINLVIYVNSNKLEDKMQNKEKIKSSIASALGLVEKLKAADNSKKIKSYRHKLISALVANDYDRFIEIMLQLSSYTDTSFSFMHELIADFDGNKNLAYAFVNALIENDYKENKTDK